MSAGHQRNVDDSYRSRLTRTLMLGVAASLLVSACGPTPTAPAAPTAAPTAAKTAPAGATTAPAAPTTAAPQKQADQVLRDYILTDEPPFLDPAMATDGNSLAPIRQVFVGLARFDKDLKVIPWAADSWDVSPDGKTYTFHIHKGIKWHDGSGELTADDFKYSIERTIKKKDSTVSMLYLGDIVGAKDLLDGKQETLESVKVVDPYTLAITLDAPKAFFLGKLVYPTSYAVKKDAVEKGGDAWATRVETLVGAGPFKLTEWTHDQRVVLSRFDDYWEGKAALARVEMPIVKDENTRLSMYEKGDLDIALVPSGQLDRVKGDAKLSKELSSYPRLQIYYLAMNQAKPPFDKKEVREAFNYGVNKAQVTEIALKGALTPADGIVPPGMPGFNKDLKPLAYDGAKAKQLLAQAGYPEGRGLPAFNIVTRQGAGTYKKIAETLTGVYKQSLGIDLTVVRAGLGRRLPGPTELPGHPVPHRLQEQPHQLPQRAGGQTPRSGGCRGGLRQTNEDLQPGRAVDRGRHALGTTRVWAGLHPAAIVRSERGADADGAALLLPDPDRGALERDLGRVHRPTRDPVRARVHRDHGHRFWADAAHPWRPDQHHHG
jgi:ABC-type transport system substrate-binding protein